MRTITSLSDVLTGIGATVGDGVREQEVGSAIFRHKQLVYVIYYQYFSFFLFGLNVSQITKLGGTFSLYLGETTWIPEHLRSLAEPSSAASGDTSPGRTFNVISRQISIDVSAADLTAILEADFGVDILQ